MLLSLSPRELKLAMSLQADVFDPEVVRAAIKALVHSTPAKQKFETDWKANVSETCNRTHGKNGHSSNNRT